MADLPWDKLNAAYRVDGYMHPSATESTASIFINSKWEVIQVLRREIEILQNLTLSEYREAKKLDFKKPE